MGVGDAAAGAHPVSRGTVLLDGAGRDVSIGGFGLWVDLTLAIALLSDAAGKKKLTGVTEVHDARDIAGAQSGVVQGVMHDFGTLAVSGEADLGSGALLQRLLGQGGHVGRARLTAGPEAGPGGGIVEALQGDVAAELAGQLREHGGADDGADVARLGGTASVDDAQRRADTVDNVVGRAAGSVAGL